MKSKDAIPDETASMSTSFEENLRARGEDEYDRVYAMAMELKKEMDELNNTGNRKDYIPDFKPIYQNA